MLDESIEEYKEICTLVRECSNSVMRYSSISVAISGSVFVAFTSIRKDGLNIEYIPIIFISISIITLLIAILINYKCESHNRLAAYRNLISAERLDDDAKGKINRNGINHRIVAFDVCMDHLNNVYAKKVFDFSTVKGKFFARKGVFENLTGDDDIDIFVSQAFPRNVSFLPNNGKYGKHRHQDNVWRILAIPYVLIFMMPGIYKKRGTWGFPDHVNRTIIFIIFMELFSSAYLFYQNNIYGKNWSITDINFASAIYILLFCIFFILFQRVCIQWQELMIGGKRIFSYFVQFVPFRMIYIKQAFSIESNQDKKLDISYFIGTKWELDE